MILKSIWQRLRDFYCTRWYASILMLFSVLMILMLIEVKNHRFNSSDFKVYYRAAERLMHGENLYQPEIDGHFHYKYSPTAALYFIPAIIFPVSAAKVLYWIVMAMIACLGFYLALIMVRPGFRSDDPRVINNLILLIGLILGVHLESEFYLGQVNHILLVSYLITIYLSSRKKDIPAAFIWAATIFVKPFGLIFLPYFLAKKKFRLVLFFILFAIILIFASLPFIGATNFTSQYRGWFQELLVDLGHKQMLLAPENHTLFSILARFTPFRLLDFTPETVFIFQLAIVGFVALLFLYLLHRGRDFKDNYVWEGAFLISLIPLLSSTGNYAFQFIELAVFLIVFNFHRMTKWWQIFAITGLVFTAINMHDLWGSTVWHFLNNISLVAIGAILLLVVLVNLRLKKIA